MRTTLLAFRTGDPRNIGNPSTQFADSTLVARVRMSGEVVSGLAVGIAEPVVGVVRFVYRGGEWVFERVTNPIQTLQAIDNGARQAIDAVNRLIAGIRDNPLQAAQDMLASLDPLWAFLKNNVNARNAMNLLFPDWVRAYDLNVSSQLVSFDGGYYLGKGISRAAFEILAAAASSGLVNLAARSSTITTIVSCIIDIARVFMARTPGLILGSVRVANTALQVVSLPQSLVVRAQVGLLRGLGSAGRNLGTRLAAPFNVFQRRRPPTSSRTPLPLVGGCFVEDTLVWLDSEEVESELDSLSANMLLGLGTVFVFFGTGHLIVAKRKRQNAEEKPLNVEVKPESDDPDDEARESKND